jgi:uncharacterized protein YdaU (DUF1376 family)
VTDWYKMNPVDWNDGTDELTLEQEGAYLRICHAIYITERPIRENWFVIAGLLRCSDRKAKRLVAELVEAGKLVLEDGQISNRRAMDEVSTRRGVSVDRSSAGRRGGVESGKSRAKALKDNDADEAIASKQNEPEEIREEEKRLPLTPSREKRFANPAITLQAALDPMTAARWISHCEEKGKRPSSQQAEQQVAVLLEMRQLGANPVAAIDFAIAKGWSSLGIEYFRNNGFKFGSGPAAATGFDWATALSMFQADGTWAHAWGPKPGEPGCRAPANMSRAA